MDFTADDLTANLMIWIALCRTYPNKLPSDPQRIALLSHATAASPRRKCPEVQTDLLTPRLGNIPPPGSSFLPTNRAGPVGTRWKGTREGPWMECVWYNNARQCLWMGLQTMLLLRGAASSFPAPSPPPFKGLCSPFENILDPKDIPNMWTKSISAVFQKGRALASSAYDYIMSLARLPPCATCSVCH